MPKLTLPLTPVEAVAAWALLNCYIAGRVAIVGTRYVTCRLTGRQLPPPPCCRTHRHVHHTPPANPLTPVETVEWAA